MWWLRSLVLAFYLKGKGKFRFSGSNVKLPIEISYYSLKYIRGEYVVSDNSCFMNNEDCKSMYKKRYV